MLRLCFWFQIISKPKAYAWLQALAQKHPCTVFSDISVLCISHLGLMDGLLYNVAQGLFPTSSFSKQSETFQLSSPKMIPPEREMSPVPVSSSLGFNLTTAEPLFKMLRPTPQRFSVVQVDPISFAQITMKRPASYRCLMKSTAYASNECVPLIQALSFEG